MLKPEFIRLRVAGYMPFFKLKKSIPEPAAEAIGGLEKYFGAYEYHRMFSSGRMLSGDAVRVPRGCLNSDKSISIFWDDYAVVKGGFIAYCSGDRLINVNPRKKLLGINWYLKKTSF